MMQKQLLNQSFIVGRKQGWNISAIMYEEHTKNSQM